MSIIVPKRILITGATSGIGYQAAIRIIKSGNSVIIPARNQASIDKFIISSTKDNVDSSLIKELVSFIFSIILFFGSAFKIEKFTNTKIVSKIIAIILK